MFFLLLVEPLLLLPHPGPQKEDIGEVSNKYRDTNVDFVMYKGMLLPSSSTEKGSKFQTSFQKSGTGMEVTQGTEIEKGDQDPHR